MNAPVDWLLDGEPWIEYRTRSDLLKQPEQDPRVLSARARMLADPLVQELAAELRGWPGTVIASHKSAGQLFHKITFAADLGLTIHDLEMKQVAAAVLTHQSEEGPFQLPANIPTHYGGTGEDTWAWALCDAPLSLYALVKMGLESYPSVQKALDHLAGLARDNGWPCAVSKEMGSFRGPGRKQDPCPFANLAMLKALSASSMWRDHPVCRSGAETLLNLWENSLTQHPYIFYMGTDFRKLKVPFVWYDLLHVLEVLSRFPWLKEDPRLLDMLAVLKAKSGPDGRFTVESAWAAWKAWEFGQKKKPSRWLTLQAWRVIQRLETTADNSVF